MESQHFSLLVLLCFGVHMSSSEILQRHKRNWIIDSFEIDEGYQGPFPYSLGKIQTEKTINLFRIHGQGVDEEPRGILKIDDKTAEITVLGPVDYEEYKVLKLTFQAIDRDKHVIDTQLGIEIKIKDSNDNPPKFERRSYTVTIEERTRQDTDVITLKATDEDSTKEYKNIKYRIVSVAPQSQDLQFYITQRSDTQTGTISFKGCLDHEKAEKYQIIVEASDQGIPKALSSSCTVTVDIQDGNNHMPVIKTQTGPGKVKEGEQDILVSRLQVEDADTHGTAAWRAKYYINGDTENNFKITTDPETNEGLLYVDKQLSFEDGSMRNITITVENEIPYYTCKVVDRSAWKVETISGVLLSGASISGGTAAGAVSGSQQIPAISSYVVTVTVEDVNEAPIFDKPNKVALLLENTAAGQYLETFTARDPDVASANTFRYVKGKDPADWISVDPDTGKVTTTKILDRESEHVVNSSYVIEIYAVDDGDPSMTSTATLTVQINDQNDNLPYLKADTLDVCQSDKPSLTSITAADKDEEPFGGPFRFKLHGDVEGKWKIEPTQGFSVNLVKDSTVHSGLYKLRVEVSDLQGETAFHDLSVRVCECINVAAPNCTLRKAPSVTAGPAVGIAFFCILLFAGLLLLAFLMTCRREKAQMPPDFSGQHLMVHNIEEQGTDCAVNFESSKGGHNLIQICPAATIKSPFTTPAAVSLGLSQKYAMSQTNTMQQEQRQNLLWMVTDSGSEGLQTQTGYGQSQGKTSMETGFTRGNYKYRTIHGSLSAMEMMQQRNSMYKLVNGSESEGLQANSGYFQRNSSMGTSFSRGTYKYSSMGSSAMGTRQWRKSLHESLDGYNLQNIGTQINKKLYILEAPGEELGDYEPHEYIEEGDEEHSFELDAISIPDVPLDLDLDLDYRFSELASVCMPGGSTVSSTKSETATVTQEWKVIKMDTPSYL